VRKFSVLVTGGAVEATMVVEAFEVIEDGGVGLGLGLEHAFFGSSSLLIEAKRLSARALS
jgi:hypothetical protein